MLFFRTCLFNPDVLVKENHVKRIPDTDYILLPRSQIAISVFKQASSSSSAPRAQVPLPRLAPLYQPDSTNAQHFPAA